MSNFVKGILIAVVIFVLDQFSKYYVFAMLDERAYPVIEVMPYFNLVKVYNYGVSFGMFNNLAYGQVILSVVAIIITIILLIWLKKVAKLHMSIALGLIIGGAIGNIVDRIRFGAVADFLDFYVGDYHWPAFNIADSAVVVGVFILLIDSFVSDDEKENKNA